jgi:copper chaperone CopZ
MVHTYNIAGMTCDSCEAKVKGSLLVLPEISSVEVSKEKKMVTISMDKHISISTLQDAFGGSDSRYQLTAKEHNELSEQTKSWINTYKPVLLIFGFITSTTLLVQLVAHHFDFMEWMRHFMAGFFLVFSFFKLLDLKAFAESYSMYDVIAKRFKLWGYFYALIELTLGLAFLIDFEPFMINWITLSIMSISLIGVLQSVINKRKIQCACLGAVFNLPMSTITIIEDALMITMSAITLIMLV